MKFQQQQEKDVRALREEIDRLTAAGESRQAQALLGELWKQEPGPNTAVFVVSRFEMLRPTLRCSGVS